MIRIHKSANVPQVLVNKGIPATDAHKALYDANPAVYKQKYHKVNNPFKLTFDSKIYGNANVKNQLKDEQFNKCCFCENKDFDDIAFGDVEHFRPKGAYQQKANDTLSYPGYYWLAYEWTNLFFSCQICNQRHKKNRFPLVDQTLRSVDHHAPQEQTSNTLLAHPSFENPENEIGFREEIPFHKTDKGKKSIQAFGLNRTKLNEKRRKHLVEVRKNIVLSRMDLSTATQDQKDQIFALLGIHDETFLVEIINTAKLYVDQAAKKEAAFTSMVRNNFPALPQ
ncbi:hypothetical protein POV27_15050 [Aureisphaera galaxeae]|uniref:hypothetical protein n=1 Tax=Aureisphaera galaxeae TaxID=1538023 RepID=UPI002350E0DF|nr:hypothetical protein [Aureisphaera galaxeae]MDC8005379.1 hypothetical protein [Aureisphaera galaxeae]